MGIWEKAVKRARKGGMWMVWREDYSMVRPQVLVTGLGALLPVNIPRSSGSWRSAKFVVVADYTGFKIPVLPVPTFQTAIYLLILYLYLYWYFLSCCRASDKPKVKPEEVMPTIGGKVRCMYNCPKDSFILDFGCFSWLLSFPQ